MWQIIKEWFKRNGLYIVIFFSVSLAIGLLSSIFCAVFPPLFLAFSSITIWGMAPFVFLSTMNLPLALFVLGSIVTGLSLASATAGVLLLKQVYLIGIHLWSLINEAPETDGRVINGSYDYFKKYLKSETPSLCLDDDVEIHEIDFDDAPEGISLSRLMPQDMNETDDNRSSPPRW